MAGVAGKTWLKHSSIYKMIPSFAMLAMLQR